MTDPTAPPIGAPHLASAPFRASLAGRLGLNLPKDFWPVGPVVKGYEAAGFSWIQVHTPPRSVLGEMESILRHARSLRGALSISGLRLMLHGPDDLTLGTPEHDRAFGGLLRYAAEAGAEIVVYHGANFPLGDAATTARVQDRLLAEEASLRRFALQAEALPVTIAVENLAPVFPGEAPRVCHSPAAVRDLVHRIGCERVGMLFDVGHAHITADAAGARLEDELAAVAGSVVLFHVHDNLGARREPQPLSGLDPLRLDLHLPPGGGRIDWTALAEMLTGHAAPLMLEVHPPHRPEPLGMAEVAGGLLSAA